jgi:hypothetical protein
LLHAVPLFISFAAKRADKDRQEKKTRHADMHNEFSYGFIEQKTWST